MHKWPPQNLILRIFFNENRQVDWHVQLPENVTFQDVTDVISQASDDLVMVTAFEYEDEDGDRITVRTDQELKTMISFHSSLSRRVEGMFVSDESPDHLSQNTPCIVIFPKATKPSNRRNVHGLKVAIAPTASSMLLSGPAALQQPKTSSLNTISDKPNFSESTSGQISYQQNPRNKILLPNFLYDSCPKSDLTVQSNAVKDKIAPLSFHLGGFSNDSLLFLETLGNGNSGIVRKALHKETQIVTAVKSITLDLTGEEQKRILQELEILKKCNGSSFIIAFYGAFFEENRVLLCTEYMDGGSLDRYGSIPYLVLRSVASAITQGLQHLWLLRIMHRDVKPSNMLVNTEGHIKLCDFGVSTQLVDSIARTYVGTNAYMAPERVIGHDYTIYSDVWSFGLSLCELATGVFPYPQLASKIAGSKGVVPMEVMQCIVHDAAPRLSTCNFPSDICDFIACCLQKEAESRLLPEQLCLHSLVTTCMRNGTENNLSLVSKWIKLKLQSR